MFTRASWPGVASPDGTTTFEFDSRDFTSVDGLDNREPGKLSGVDQDVEGRGAGLQGMGPPRAKKKGRAMAAFFFFSTLSSGYICMASRISNLLILRCRRRSRCRRLTGRMYRPRTRSTREPLAGVSRVPLAFGWRTWRIPPSCSYREVELLRPPCGSGFFASLCGVRKCRESLYRLFAGWLRPDARFLPG
jgi:hypothetical protein